MEQLDLLDLISLANGEFDILTSKTFEKDNQEVDESFENYLQKGEKIISLLREKMKSKSFKKSTFLNCVNYKVYATKRLGKKEEYLVNCIRDKMIRPVVNEIFDKHKEYQKHGKQEIAFKGFTDLFHDFSGQITCSLVPTYDYPDRLMSSFFRSKGGHSATLEIKVLSDGSDVPMKFYAALGTKSYLTAKQSGRTWSLRSANNYLNCIDIGSFFPKLVLYFQLRKRVQEILKDLSVDEKKDNKVFCMLIEEQFKILNESAVNGVVYVQEEAFNLDYVKEFFKGNIPYKVVSKDEEKSLRNDIRCILTISNFAPIFFLSSDANWIFQELYSYCGRSGRFELSGNINEKLAINLFELLSEEYLEDMKSEKFRKQLESEYAKSYQTKKNIPQKYLKAMKDSSFNDYFGYVEFDEDCDLTKIVELEKEFNALASYMKWDKKDDVSLRFRKLGHHKAAGLYYPAFKCICVDVRHPSSFAHEYFHMLDYEHNEVSRGYKFAKVLTMYRNTLNDYMLSLPNGDVIKERLNGSTKYNKDYYLQPTEVFARCGEMYLVRYKKVDNSLVKPEGGFAYPESEDLMKAIIEFYDEFLGLNKKEEVALKVASY